MKIQRARKSKKGRIEIIPMIDIMFFLLATFMMASLTIHHFDMLPVNLATGRATPITDDKKPTLTIDKNNELFLDKESVKLENLTQKLQPLMQGKNKTLIVASDNQALQGTTAKAMLAARAAGVEKFAIIVKH